MSPGNNLTPKTLIDCFAEANKFILLAAAADARVAPLLRNATDSFLNVSAHAKARTHVKLGTANPQVDYPPGTDEHVILLHKAILVLSLCAFECPREVSTLILHISEFMDPPRSDGFAPTIVDVETSMTAVDVEKERMADLAADKEEETSKAFKNVESVYPSKSDGFAPTIVDVETCTTVMDMDKERMVEFAVDQEEEGNKDDKKGMLKANVLIRQSLYHPPHRL
jgi:hypothetical protein